MKSTKIFLLIFIIIIFTLLSIFAVNYSLIYVKLIDTNVYKKEFLKRDLIQSLIIVLPQYITLGAIFFFYRKQIFPSLFKQNEPDGSDISE